MTMSTESMDSDITRVVLDGRLDIEGAESIDMRMNVVAGSALCGVQETLLLAIPGSELRTEVGIWEVTWNGIQRK